MNKIQLYTRLVVSDTVIKPWILSKVYSYGNKINNAIASK